MPFAIFVTMRMTGPIGHPRFRSNVRLPSRLVRGTKTLDSVFLDHFQVLSRISPAYPMTRRSGLHPAIPLLPS